MAVPVELPTSSEQRAKDSGERPNENDIAARGKQHYTVDYFVIVDYAIYNR